MTVTKLEDLCSCLVGVHFVFNGRLCKIPSQILCHLISKLVPCPSLPVYTAPCSVPLGTASPWKVCFPSYTSDVPSALNVDALLTLEPHVNLPAVVIWHFPFDDSRVKEPEEAVAVKVAHVPVVYQVPAEIRQPFFSPPVMTFRYPFPLNAGPVEVGEGAEEVAEGVEEVAVFVGVALDPPPDPLGRYLIPVLGQVDEPPILLAGTKVPVWTEPRTLK